MHQLFRHCAVVSLDDLPDEPQIAHNGILFERDHPKAGRMRQCGPAARFSKTPAEAGPIAPLLGEHSDEILAELGYDSERIAALCAADVIS